MRTSSYHVERENFVSPDTLTILFIPVIEPSGSLYLGISSIKKGPLSPIIFWWKWILSIDHTYIHGSEITVIQIKRVLTHTVRTHHVSRKTGAYENLHLWEESRTPFQPHEH